MQVKSINQAEKFLKHLLICIQVTYKLRDIVPAGIFQI